jgi:glycosyltransferase involved in cell wall biosynthesis
VSPRNDIAIYSPFAGYFYEDAGAGPAERRAGGGGAELQATLLARHLARRGLKVAHIVYPLERPAPRPLASPEVIQRLPQVSSRRRSRIGRAVGKLADANRIWRALNAADAQLYVLRSGLSGATVTGALFCLYHRRRLVFAASNDLDFTFGRDGRPRLTEALYRFALKRARRVVVQSRRQLQLAAAVVDPDRVDLIPSFAELADPPNGAADHHEFLWAGRLVEYKLPLRYLELARSMPEAPFRMIAAETGETSGALAAQVTEGAAELPNLQLEPRQGRERVLELIARSTAVVVTSRHEGMPNLFLEAWARGVPVLSLHFDPDGRIAGEGIGLYAAGSWPRFVSGAKKLWRDRALRREIGERGRGYVRRVHSPGAVAARWEETLRKAVE